MDEQQTWIEIFCKRFNGLRNELSGKVCEHFLFVYGHLTFLTALTSPLPLLLTETPRKDRALRVFEPRGDCEHDEQSDERVDDKVEEDRERSRRHATQLGKRYGIESRNPSVFCKSHSDPH